MGTRTITTALLALVLCAGTIFATTTSTPVFIGKGDVQTVLGLNNTGMNTAAPFLVWDYSETTVEWVECERQNNRNVVEQTRTRTRSVEATVSYEVRRNGNGNVTGFWLTFGELTYGGDNASLDCPAVDGWEEVGRGEDVLGGGLTVNGESLSFTL
jgi:hypothetical protein